MDREDVTEVPDGIDPRGAAFTWISCVAYAIIAGRVSLGVEYDLRNRVYEMTEGRF